MISVRLIRHKVRWRLSLFSHIATNILFVEEVGCVELYLHILYPPRWSSGTLTNRLMQQSAYLITSSVGLGFGWIH